MAMNARNQHRLRDLTFSGKDPVHLRRLHSCSIWLERFLERMKELSAFYAFVLLVALTNMELMRLLPWRKAPTMYDGLPDKRLMLRVWVLVVCLEDVPQLAI